MALIGIAVGTALALVWSKLFAVMLVMQNTLDPIVLGAAASIVFVFCLAASLVPLRRAADIDPVRSPPGVGGR